MAAWDPYQQTGGRPQQPGIPQAEPLPQATPLGPDQPLPKAQPVQPSQSPPQARPVQPTQPLPQTPAPPPTQPSPQPQVGTAAGQMATARPIAVRGDPSKIAVYRRDDEEEYEQEITSAALKHSPPWLISAAFHMALLIILGLLVVAIQQRNQVDLDVVVEEDIWAEKLGDQTEFDSPLGMANVDEIQEPELAISDLPEVDDPFAAPPKLELYPDGTMSTSDLQAKIPGLALSGREEGSKRSLLGRYGGNRLTEEAVIRGLRWLARQQSKTGRDAGSWSLAGPYTDGVPEDFDNHVAATAMALLAFQGHGNTHKKGKFKSNVADGWKWLLKQQDGNGNFFHEGGGNHHFYTQGQATIAICELYGMSQDEKYKEPAERALRYCLNSQSPKGGWRYNPAGDSDVSVTGWVVMALQSAKMAGLEVPEDNFRRVERYLDGVAQNGGSRYPYQRGREATVAMTAEALLCRQYLGWPRDDPRLVEGVEWITLPENLISYDPARRNTYYWYYATQVCHHMEGEHWKRWNDVMRETLPRKQVRTGREDGSWDPNDDDRFEVHGGRLYTTCLSIYMLQVYYRHLPLYTKIYTNLFKSGRTPGT